MSVHGMQYDETIAVIYMVVNAQGLFLTVDDNWTSDKNKGQPFMKKVHAERLLKDNPIEAADCSIQEYHLEVFRPGKDC